MFTATERAALIAAAAMVDVEGIGDDDLPGELGTAVSQDQALVVVRVHGRVVELRDAIADRRAVRFHYRGTERTVDPYVLGMWRNRWYLVARDHDVDDDPQVPARPHRDRRRPVDRSRRPVRRARS